MTQPYKLHCMLYNIFFSINAQKYKINYNRYHIAGLKQSLVNAKSFQKTEMQVTN